MSVELLDISGGSLVLDMGLTARAFAQTKLTDFIDEEGVYVKPESAQVHPWSFNQTIERNGFISVAGPLPETSGFTPLLDILTAADPAQKIEAILRFNAAVELLADNEDKADLALSGPACTLISKEGVLFLPPTLASNAVNGRATESARLRSAWLNPSLTGIAALRFLESAILYYTLSGLLPYSETDEEARQTDHRDGNYIPIGLQAPACPAKLGRAIDANLTLHPAQKKESEPLNADAAMITAALGPADPDTAAGVRAEKKKYEKALSRRLLYIRFTRRYSGFFVAAGIIICIAGIAIASTISGRRGEPTVTGLSSYETVLAFYSGMNELDISRMQAAVQKGTGREYIDFISTIYVTAKMREGIEAVLTVPPAIWVQNPEFASRVPFGIAGLNINGQDEAGYVNLPPLPSVRDNPPPLREEDGEAIQEGAEKTYEARFYLWTVGENAERTSVVLTRDHITLRFSEGRWQIRDISRESQAEEDTVSFARSDIAQQISAELEHTSDLPLAIHNLRLNHPWLPSEAETEAGITKESERIQALSQTLSGSL